MMKTYELNFDGLVGPTHNYSGMSFGNIASESHKGEVSHPREAALQGLRKMRFLHDLGVKQAVLPPLPRPHNGMVTRLGFADISRMAQHAPHLLPLVYSASSMWVANAATISPSADTADGKVHFTPANLATHFHRSIEAEQTGAVLRAIFANPAHFTHHAPLPMHPRFGDEGAANFMRFAPYHGAAGLEALVYGEKTQTYPARQTKEASEAVFRLHGVKRHVVLQQNPAAIDAGVFHNDVIAVANENALLYHEDAFAGGETAVDTLEAACGHSLHRLRVLRSEVSVEEAVKSYLFNSQLVTLPEGKMAVIAPTEAEENPRVRAVLERFKHSEESLIAAVHFLNLRESMKNGGGPACLRLRVVLTEAELAAMHPGVLFTPTLQATLEDWITRHYRESLTPADLTDPQLATESLTAHAELMQILGIAPQLILSSP